MREALTPIVTIVLAGNGAGRAGRPGCHGTPGRFQGPGDHRRVREGDGPVAKGLRGVQQPGVGHRPQRLGGHGAQRRPGPRQGAGQTMRRPRGGVG